MEKLFYLILFLMATNPLLIDNTSINTNSLNSDIPLLEHVVFGLH
jgi:hypothetical protein